MASIDLPMSSDTFLRSDTTTTNYSSNTTIQVGESNAGAITLRGLLTPDFSSLSSKAVITAAVLKLTPVADAADFSSTVYCHRVLKNTVHAQATWNNYSTGNAWYTSGCNDRTDYDWNEVVGFMAVDASPTLNSQLSMNLDISILQKMIAGTYSNYGFVLFTEYESNDMISYASTDHGTSAYRPIITVTYYLSVGAAAFF